MTMPRALWFSVLSVLLLLTTGCGMVGGSAPPGTSAGAADQAKPADDKKAEQDKKAEERKQQQKDLAQKRRELDYAKVGVQTQALEARVRTMAVDAAVAHAQVELDKQKRELEVFLQQIKPRELEEQRIQHDYSSNRAEEAKDELAELQGMYKNDEFARTTKELVIKRGQRQVEMADRHLAVSRQELDLLEKHTMVERERELRQKVKDAEQETEKARIEHEKAMLELGVSQRQADDKVKDLQRDIAEIEQKLAEPAK